MKQNSLRLPPRQPESAYLTNTVTFGAHLHRTEGEETTVCYVDDARKIRRTVVNEHGEFCDFPIVVTEKSWLSRLSDPGALKNRIRYRTSFEKIGGGFLVLWCVQPDGRYFEDEDGFGAETCEEIVLYSFLDTEGVLCAPFRIYSVGTERFYTAPSDEQDECVPPPPTQSSAPETDKNHLLLREVTWITAFLGNALILFIITFLADSYDTYYGKNSPYSTVFEYMLDDVLWLFLLALLLFNSALFFLSRRLPVWIKNRQTKAHHAKKERPEKAERVKKERPAKPPRPKTERPRKSRKAERTLSELERLKSLLDSGAVTQEEFESLKENLLSQK